jgi:S1-C subfamily serine protease
MNLGTAVLRRFRVITDYPRDRLWVIADPQAVAEPFRKNRSGVRSLFRGSHLEITHVSRGSPAEASGLREGDKIVAVNGQTIDAAYITDGRELWGERPSGTIIELTLSDGAKRSLTLADYF